MLSSDSTVYFSTSGLTKSHTYTHTQTQQPFYFKTFSFFLLCSKRLIMQASGCFFLANLEFSVLLNFKCRWIWYSTGQSQAILGRMVAPGLLHVQLREVIQVSGQLKPNNPSLLILFSEHLNWSPDPIKVPQPKGVSPPNGPDGAETKDAARPSLFIHLFSLLILFNFSIFMSLIRSLGSSVSARHKRKGLMLDFWLRNGIYTKCINRNLEPSELCPVFSQN